MTKCTWNPQTQQLEPGGKPTGQHESLPVPGGRGRTAADLSSSELARVLVAAGVTGASASNGRQSNLKSYFDFLDRIKKAAADKAVSNWLEGHHDD